MDFGSIQTGLLMNSEIALGISYIHIYARQQAWQWQL